MSRRPIDFLVVGGGPAGSAFAILAARAGASVVLAERTDYSARRPGEHLAGRIRPLLDSLGVEKSAFAGIAEPSGGIVSLWSGDAPAIVKPYRAMGDRMAVATIRHRFDEVLSNSAALAGATVLRATSLATITPRTGAPWDAVLRDADGRPLEYQPRAVVDASGRNATVARRQGARRVNHGDLVAIVAWLELAQPSDRVGTPLTVESCEYGWWSVSMTSESLIVATLYTTAHLMKASRLPTDALWQTALDSTQFAREIVFTRAAPTRQFRVFPASPSIATRVFGDGWISVGDAAVTLDPLGGQGVAFALETAFRAFEAACVDPTWTALGETYHEALAERFERHLSGRATVYAQASEILSDSFRDSNAVPDLTTIGNDKSLRVLRPDSQ